MLVDDVMCSPCGTVAFMAPEVLKTGQVESDSDGYDLACDIWSLGCVLYCCLVGYPPFFQDPPELYEAVLAAVYDFEDFSGSSEARDLVSYPS